jgi:hypothetical protein
VRRWLWAIPGIVVVIAVLAVINNVVEEANKQSPPSAATLNADDMVNQQPLVLTYFFYWYDAELGGHLQEDSGLPTHLPADPAPSWRSVEWFSQQLQDMSAAGIDVVLPVFWGSDEDWSLGGLPNLAESRRKLEEGNQKAPDVGMFFDTTILGGRDLTQTDGQLFFYNNIRIFFESIPREQWALIDDRPIIWLYFSFFATAFDNDTFDFVYDSFERDFGVRPYIVREVSWDFAKSLSRDVIEEQPIETDANYKWGAALEGYFERGSVAAVGPGFDEREIPGRGNAYRPRDDGAWYRENFERAIASNKPLLVIETWNEIHEASGIGETVEYGRHYIDVTAMLVEQYKSELGGGLQ